MIYGARSNGKQHGQVITKPVVVNKMLDRVGYVSTRDLSLTRIIEPAAGDGAFAIPILTRLYESSLNFGFNFKTALSKVLFYEIDQNMSLSLKIRICDLLDSYATPIPASLIKVEDFLLSDIPECDVVIGNPPYVRHENIPVIQKSIYRKTFGTFTHRSDLYIAFYEKGLKILKDEGVLSYICSNRWLKNQYGNELRKLIRHSFSFIEVIDLEDISAFEEDVLSYPSITTVKKTDKRSLPDYYKIANLKELDNLPVSSKPIKKLNIYASNWFSNIDPTHLHYKFLDTIINQGFKIGIGVATGSDAIFIRKDFKDIIENELLLPILKSKDLRGNRLSWSGNYIFNPFTKKGDLIALEKFPKAKKYLESKRDVLMKRHISKNNPQFWYKTIDRINPELLAKDKILLPDISGNTLLLIDRGNFYPHHNLYYITGKSYHELKVLAAVLMSDFVFRQLIEFGNCMNGGYPRWQSQNIKKLRIPIIDAIPENAVQELIKAYNRHDIELINRLIIPDRIAEYKIAVGQTSLFEKEAHYKPDQEED